MRLAHGFRRPGIEPQDLGSRCLGGKVRVAISGELLGLPISQPTGRASAIQVAAVASEATVLQRLVSQQVARVRGVHIGSKADSDRFNARPVDQVVREAHGLLVDGKHRDIRVARSSGDGMQVAMKQPNGGCVGILSGQ